VEAAEFKIMATKIRAELEDLEIQQEDTARRIARLKQTLVGLEPLSELSANSSTPTKVGEFPRLLSLTDAARQILQAHMEPLTPLEIRDKLVNMGHDFKGQKSVMASVHSLLKRLVVSGEIETKGNGYQWKGVRRWPRRK
jgi:hypothetical protein